MEIYLLFPFYSFVSSPAIETSMDMDNLLFRLCRGCVKDHSTSALRRTQVFSRKTSFLLIQVQMFQRTDNPEAQGASFLSAVIHKTWHFFVLEPFIFLQYGNRCLTSAAEVFRSVKKINIYIDIFKPIYFTCLGETTGDVKLYSRKPKPCSANQSWLTWLLDVWLLVYPVVWMLVPPRCKPIREDIFDAV